MLGLPPHHRSRIWHRQGQLQNVVRLPHQPMIQGALRPTPTHIPHCRLRMPSHMLTTPRVDPLLPLCAGTIKHQAAASGARCAPASTPCGPLLALSTSTPPSTPPSIAPPFDLNGHKTWTMGAQCGMPRLLTHVLDPGCRFGATEVAGGSWQGSPSNRGMRMASVFAIGSYRICVHGLFLNDL